MHHPELHIFEQPTNIGGEVNDVGWLEALEESDALIKIRQVSVRTASKEPLCSITSKLSTWISGDDLFDRCTNEPRASCY